MQTVVDALDEHARVVALLTDRVRRFDGIGDSFLLGFVFAVVLFVVLDGLKVAITHHGIGRKRHINRSLALPASASPWRR